MNQLHNLVRVTTATTGTGTVTLGAAVASFLTFALGGVVNGEIVSYAIEDTNGGREIGRGTYTAAGPTLARTQIYRSTGAGNNTAITLSGSAQVIITVAAEDLMGIAQADITGLKVTDKPTFAGATYTAGISFGLNVATGVDLSKHIALYSTNWGINVTSGQINVIANGAVVGYFTGNGFVGSVFATAIQAPNYGIGTGATTNQGTVGLLTSNQPHINFYGTGTAGAGKTEVWSSSPSVNYTAYSTPYNGFNGTIDAGGSQITTGNAGGTVGLASMIPGTASQSGFFAHYNAAGTRMGYLGWATDAPHYTIEVGGKFVFDGGDVLLSTGRIGVGMIGASAPAAGLDVRTNAASGYTSWLVNYHVTAGDDCLLVACGATTDASSGLLIFYDGAVAAYQGGIFRNGAGTVVYATTSDVRLKSDIRDSETGLDHLLRMRVRDYKSLDGTDQHGFVAQELAEIYPSAVHSSDRLPWAVDYGRVTPLLVRAIQQQQAQITDLRHQVEALYGRLQ